MAKTALSGLWDDLVVVCAANTWDGVKLADQHMAECLARLTPVLYVDPPMSRLSARHNPLAAQALERPHLRVVGDGLARLTPVVAPFPLRRGMVAVTQHLTRRVISRAVGALQPARVKALVSAWPQLDVFGAARENLTVFWAQDDFAAGARLMGLDPGRVARGERRRAAVAHFVVAANPAVANRWRGAGLEVELVPYGADTASFEDVAGASPAAGVELRPPIAIVVGHLNARIDASLLSAVAGSDLSVLLVGPKADDGRLDDLLRRPNVQWVGPQPFEALPGFLRHAAVGLVPYADTGFNRASFPLKTLEYLAAGLPVVATGLPATRWLDTDLVAVADAPEDFAAATLAAAHAPQDSALVARRRAFASRHSYDQRARDLLAALDGHARG